MPKKKSIRLAARNFDDAADSVINFVTTVRPLLSETHVSWCHDYAIIALYRAFERLMLDALVGAINNNPSKTISHQSGVSFPRNLTDEVCEYIIVGDGFFDFKGRSGLIKILRRFLSENHFIVEVVKDQRYKHAIDRLTSLRNFAAHRSDVSKRAVKQVLNVDRIRSAGTWLKTQGRLGTLTTRLKELADELESRAPY